MRQRTRNAMKHELQKAYDDGKGAGLSAGYEKGYKAGEVKTVRRIAQWMREMRSHPDAPSHVMLDLASAIEGYQFKPRHKTNE